MTKNEVQKLFRGYKHFTHRMEQTLYGWGFRIKRRQNHNILSYQLNDGRSICFVVAKTPSDRRSGLNIASRIYNTIIQRFD